MYKFVCAYDRLEWRGCVVTNFLKYAAHLQFQMKKFVLINQFCAVLVKELFH